MKSCETIISKKAILAILLLLIATVAFLADYISKNKIYGEFLVNIYQNDTSINQYADVSGESFFNKKYELNKINQRGFVNNNQYLKKINIKFKADSICPKTNVNLIITDENNIVLYNAIIKDLNTHNNMIVHTVYQLNYDHSLFQKLAKMKVYNVFKRKLVYFSIVFSLLAAVIIMVLRSKMLSKIFKKNKLIFFLIVIAYLGLILFCYDYFIKGKILVYTGIYLHLIVFSSLLILLFFILKKNHEKRINIMLIFFSVFAVIFLSELFLRFFKSKSICSEIYFGYYEFMKDSYDHQRYINRVANYELELKSDEFRYLRKTNSLGLSDKEPEIKKEENDFLIIALGDSFTEGDDAHQDSTWVKFLERKVGNHDSLNYRFLNTGICGSDPFYQYRLLKDKLLVYNPDLVMVAYGYDVEDVMLIGGYERFNPDFEIEIVPNKIFEHAYAFSYLFRQFVHGPMGYCDLLLSPEKHKQRRKFAIQKLKESTLLFNELAKKEGFDLLLIFYPLKKEVINQNYRDWDIVVDFAQSYGIETFRLLDYFVLEEGMNIDNVNDYYWDRDGHHNAKGYEAFGNGVYWKLNQMDYVE